MKDPIRRMTRLIGALFWIQEVGGFTDEEMMKAFEYWRTEATSTPPWTYSEPLGRSPLPEGERHARSNIHE